MHRRTESGGDDGLKRCRPQGMMLEFDETGYFTGLAWSCLSRCAHVFWRLMGAQSMHFCIGPLGDEVSGHRKECGDHD